MGFNLSQCPPTEEIRASLRLPALPSRLDLADTLCAAMSAQLSAILPRMSHDTWCFMARWLLAICSPSRLFRVCFTDPLGLGLKARSDIPQHVVLPCLWGLPTPIPLPAFRQLMAEDKSFTAKTCTRMRDPDPPYDTGLPNVILGPINLANHSCLSHSSLSPDDLPLPSGFRPTPPPSFLSATDWATAHTSDAVKAGSPLTIFYGKEETLPCPHCPSPQSADTLDHRAWCSLISKGRDWGPRLLAEDWVLLSVISFTSNKAPGEMLTHSVGSIRDLMLSITPAFDAVRPLLQATRHRTAVALSKAFDASLDLISFCFPREQRKYEAAKSKFWDFIARFICSLDLGLASRQRGSLRIICGNQGTYRTLSTKALSTVEGMERPIPHLWGENVRLSATALSVFSKVNSLSSRSLFKAPYCGLHFVHIGPLAKLPHSCLSCANVMPSSDPYSKGVDNMGVPCGYNRGAWSRRVIPTNTLLHYSRGPLSEGNWWQRTEADTDFHGSCEFCADSHSSLDSQLVAPLAHPRS